MPHPHPSTPFRSPMAIAVRRALGLTLSGALLGLPMSALAQDDGVESDTVVVTATALKVAVPLAETPRSVSSVQREELDERNVQSLDESFRYRAGVLSGHYGADNNTNWFKVRGFDQATYMNGLRLFDPGYYEWTPEPYGLESVDVFKGPASILYGEAPSGGLINAVSKRPTAEPRGEINIQAGNRQHRQLAFDTSGPVTESGDVRYRMVGLYKERDGDLDGTDNERYYFAPSLEWDISDDTELTLLASIQKDDGVPENPFKLAYGTIQDTPFGKVDPETNYGAPDYDKDERTQVSLGYELSHRLDDTWKFEQNFRYSHLDLDLRSTYMDFATGDGRTAYRGHLQRDGEIDNLTVDNRMIGKWYTERTENTLLLGVDYQELSLDGKEFDDFTYDTVDIFDPDTSITPVDRSQLFGRQIDKQQLGIYVQDQLRIDDRWVLLGSVRHDSADVENTNQSLDVTVDETQSHTSYSGGVMYLADNGISPYLSYTESFSPQAETNVDGAIFEEIEGKQWEAGIKYAPLFWDGYVSAAVFDIEESNSFETTPAGYQAQAGERSATGLEIESVGYLTDQLQLTASYTYTDARDAEDNRAALIPRHQASAWLDYGFQQGALRGLKLGGGVRYVGESVDGDITVPDYTLVDAMASYDFADHWRAQVNVNNLIDKEYVASCDFWCYYGESRSVIGSLSYRW
ncbi:TonB-dependent siderophore receptor [Halomonas eurihalina]|uniref:TonB-dependent siderophore receptor n=1 Tax=Halomonas eurihalina TaxID=42566 RepID=A0A5D9DDL5_HALER|nr:TonB-dependent siderophore receptor [Halomonas eurihalina]MDR5857901.1 TonB-dependent siderophore receptor [Halomonas eurihalina]TZG41583.1 TonB-dependent siderophore receptor [Halomonas eurihalina]